jgi:hypothetical protein
MLVNPLSAVSRGNRISCADAAIIASGNLMLLALFNLIAKSVIND